MTEKTKIQKARVSRGQSQSRDRQPTAGTVEYYEINQTCGIPKPHNKTANVPGLIIDMVNNPPLKALHNVKSNMYKTVEP